MSWQSERSEYIAGRGARPAECSGRSGGKDVADPNKRNIIVVGASAGGVEALSALVRSLPPGFPAAVLVVLHVPAHSGSVLPGILSRRGPLPAKHAEDGDALRAGQIYVAPPDHHLLIHDGTIRVPRGPHENGHRPAVDPLFRSAARVGGARVMGVVLSGMLDDGTAGLLAIKRRGGLAIVQDPADALFAGMPASAVQNVAVDHVLPVAEIGPLLARLAGGDAAGGSDPAEDTEMNETDDALKVEVNAAAMEPEALTADQRAGTPSAMSCPDCGGVLWEVQDSHLVRFRCRVGHAYSADTLLSEQSEALDAALWTALRALEENRALARRLEERAKQRAHRLAAVRFSQTAEEAEARIAVIRLALRRDPYPRKPPEGKDVLAV